MGEFKVIETQEQLDAVIGERLKRERETIKKEYEGFLSPEDVQEKYKDFMSPESVQEKYKKYLSPEEAAKKDTLIKKYERESHKVKAALEIGLPYELAGRIAGETEEEIRKDAEALAGFLKKGSPYPEYDPDTTGKDAKQAAMKKMLSNLKGE